jgi:hypothetical protein
MVRFDTQEPIRMRHAAVTIACALMLSACNEAAEVSARNASVEQVAEQVRTATKDEMFIRPGKWQSKVTIEDVSMPGIPPEMAQQMKAMIAQREQQTPEQCLTEETAREEFFGGKNNACRYEHFNMSGGKIDAKMRCQANGATQIMAMNGTYSPDSYSMRMATRSEAAAGAAGGMEMKMRVDSKRIGDCGAQAGGSTAGG